MDLSTLPDLVQHFSFAVHFVPDFVNNGAEPVRNLVAAFGAKSSYSAGEKVYHAGKCVVLGGLLGFSVMTLNVEGMLGTGFAQADEIVELHNRGWAARHGNGASSALHA